MAVEERVAATERYEEEKAMHWEAEGAGRWTKVNGERLEVVAEGRVGCSGRKE